MGLKEIDADLATPEPVAPKTGLAAIDADLAKLEASPQPTPTDIATQAGLPGEGGPQANIGWKPDWSQLPSAVGNVLRQWFMEPFQQGGMLAPSPEQAAAMELHPRPILTGSPEWFARMQPAAGLLAGFGTVARPITQLRPPIIPEIVRGPARIGREPIPIAPGPQVRRVPAEQIRPVAPPEPVIEPTYPLPPPEPIPVLQPKPSPIPAPVQEAAAKVSPVEVPQPVREAAPTTQLPPPVEQIVAPLPSVTIQVNATPTRGLESQIAAAGKNRTLAQQFSRLGITQLSVEPPYKFGLSEQARIDPNTGQIEVSADATDVAHSIAHELAHDILNRVPRETRAAIEDYVTKVQIYPKHAGGMDERIAEFVADVLTGRANAPDLVGSQLVKDFLSATLGPRPQREVSKPTPEEIAAQEEDAARLAVPAGQTVRSWKDIVDAGGYITGQDNLREIVRQYGDFPLGIKDVRGGRHVLPASMAVDVLEGPGGEYVKEVYTLHTGGTPFGGVAGLKYDIEKLPQIINRTGPYAWLKPLTPKQKAEYEAELSDKQRKLEMLQRGETIPMAPRTDLPTVLIDPKVGPEPLRKAIQHAQQALGEKAKVAIPETPQPTPLRPMQPRTGTQGPPEGVERRAPVQAATPTEAPPPQSEQPAPTAEAPAATAQQATPAEPPAREDVAPTTGAATTTSAKKPWEMTREDPRSKKFKYNEELSHVPSTDTITEYEGRRIGYSNDPIIVTSDNYVIDGHGRLSNARFRGDKEISIIRLPIKNSTIENDPAFTWSKAAAEISKVVYEQAGFTERSEAIIRESPDYRSDDLAFELIPSLRAVREPTLTAAKPLTRPDQLASLPVGTRVRDNEGNVWTKTREQAPAWKFGQYERTSGDLAEMTPTVEGTTTPESVPTTPVQVGDVFTIDQANGKWYINRPGIPKEHLNQGKPFASQQEAVSRANELLPEELKRIRREKAASEKEAHRASLPRNADVDRIASENTPHDRDPIEGSGELRAMPGDIESRVVWNVKRGQSLVPNDLSTIGVSGTSPDVRGIHVGEPDYWRQRLQKDYGRQGGKTINIRLAEGDRLIEDPQYVTDPDTGEKADSAVLLTGRKTLEYGKDWVFDGEEFTEPSQATAPVPAEKPAAPSAEQPTSTTQEVDRQKLEDQRTLLRDVMSVKREKGEPIPDEWRKRLAEVEAQLSGESPSSGAIASDTVFGHPEATNIRPEKYGNLIPIKVSDRASVEKFRLRAQAALDELQAKLGMADSIVRGSVKGDKKKATSYLNSQQRVEDESVRDFIRNETLPELNRLWKSLPEQEGKTESAPSAKKPSPLADAEPGMRATAQRIENAKARFAESVVEQFGLTPEQAKTVLDEYLKNKVLTIDAVGGGYTLKDGRLWQDDAIRRAAGIEEEAASETPPLWKPAEGAIQVVKAGEAGPAGKWNAVRWRRDILRQLDDTPVGTEVTTVEAGEDPESAMTYTKLADGRWRVEPNVEEVEQADIEADIFDNENAPAAVSVWLKHPTGQAESLPLGAGKVQEAPNVPTPIAAPTPAEVPPAAAGVSGGRGGAESPRPQPAPVSVSGPQPELKVLRELGKRQRELTRERGNLQGTIKSADSTLRYPPRRRTARYVEQERKATKERDTASVRLKVVEKELADLWKGHDVEKSDYYEYVEKGKQLPDSRLNLYADWKPTGVTQPVPGESDLDVFQRGVAAHEQQILRYGDESNDYSRAGAGLAEVLKSKGVDVSKDIGTTASGSPVSDFINRWHNPLASTTKEDLQRPDVVEVLSKRLDGRLQDIVSGPEEWHIRQILEMRLPGETSLPVTKRQMRDAASRDERALEEALGENGDLQRIRGWAAGLEREAEDVRNLLGETNATKAAQDRAAKWWKAADQWEQALKDRAEQYRERGAPTPPEELLRRFGNPDEVDRVAQTLLETVPPSQITDLRGMRGQESIAAAIRSSPELLGTTLAKVIQGVPPERVQEAVARLLDEEGYVWPYQPRKYALKKSEVVGVEERAGADIKGWQSTVGGRPVWFTGHFVEFSEPPKGLRMMTEELAKAENRQIPDVSKVLPAVKDLTTPLTPVARTTVVNKGGTPTGDTQVIAVTPNGDQVFIDGGYFDHMTSRHPGGQWMAGKKETDPIALVQGGQIDALVMPMRGEPNPTVAEALKAGKISPASATPEPPGPTPPVVRQAAKPKSRAKVPPQVAGAAKPVEPPEEVRKAVGKQSEVPPQVPGGKKGLSSVRTPSNQALELMSPEEFDKNVLAHVPLYQSGGKQGTEGADQPNIVEKIKREGLLGGPRGYPLARVPSVADELSGAATKRNQPETYVLVPASAEDHRIGADVGLSRGRGPDEILGVAEVQPGETIHAAILRQAIDQKLPVSAASVDALKLTLPNGYIREKDKYVFRAGNVKSSSASGNAWGHPIRDNFTREMERRGYTLQLPRNQDLSPNPNALTNEGTTYATFVSPDGNVKQAVSTDILFERKGEVWRGDPSAGVKDGFTLEIIHTEPSQRGKGLAGKMFRDMIEVADMVGAKLYAEVAPVKSMIKRGEKSLSKNDLLKWYESLGFKRVGSSLIERDPQKPPN